MNKNIMSYVANIEKSNLKKRYLIWLYKTIKESLDRIDRKFTQLDIDKKIYKRLKDIKVFKNKSGWQRLLDDFRNYIDKKEKDGLTLVYSDSQKHLKVDYLFLKNKLRIVERLISKEFGARELKHIKSLYEEEMVKRIIQEREHK